MEEIHHSKGFLHEFCHFLAFSIVTVSFVASIFFIIFPMPLPVYIGVIIGSLIYSLSFLIYPFWYYSRQGDEIRIFRSESEDNKCVVLDKSTIKPYYIVLGTDETFSKIAASLLLLLFLTLILLLIGLITSLP